MGQFNRHITKKIKKTTGIVNYILDTLSTEYNQQTRMLNAHTKLDNKYYELALANILMYYWISFRNIDAM